MPYKAKGTFQSSNGALTVPWPTSGTYAVGDFGLLIVESANEAIATPSGWTQVSSSPQSTGTAATAGGVRLGLFWKNAASTAEASVSVPDTGNHTTAFIAVFTPSTIGATAGGVNSSANTYFYAPNVTTTVPGCDIVVCIANDQDLAATSGLGFDSPNADIGLGLFTLIHHQTVATGVGGGVGMAVATKWTAGAIGTTVRFDTSNNTSAFITLALRPTTYYVSVEEVQAGSGYAAGGREWYGLTATTLIDRTTFSSESSSQISATLSTAAQEVEAVESSTKAYFAENTLSPTTIEGLIFATETKQNPTSTFPSAYSCAAFSSTDNGYFLGGYTGGVLSSIRAIGFSDEATRTLSAVLGAAKSDGCGVASGVAGYHGGGTTGTDVTAIDRLLFSTEAVTNTIASLALARNSSAGVSGYDRGYFLGGAVNTTASAEIDGIIFSSNTATNPAAALKAGRVNAPAFGSSIAGYVIGGSAPTTCRQSERLRYATETTAETSAMLVTARFGGAGTNTPKVATVVDSSDGSVGAPPLTGATTEAASAAGTPDSTAVMGVASTHATSAADSSVGGASVSSATSEPTTAADAPAGSYTTSSDRTEAGAATTAHDSASSTGLDRSEPTTAATSQDSNAAFGVVGTAPGSAADVPAVTASFVSDRAEPATAADAPAGSATWPVSGAEAGAAGDSKDANQAQGVATSEPTSAAESSGVIASFVSDRTEPASAAESPAAQAVFVSTITEAGNATDAPASFALFVVTISNAATAADSPASSATFINDHTAAAGAADASANTLATSAERSEPVAATDAPDGQRFGSLSETVYETAPATDAPNSTGVLGVAGSAAATADAAPDSFASLPVAGSAAGSAAEASDSSRGSTLTADGIEQGGANDTSAVAPTWAVQITDATSALDSGAGFNATAATTSATASAGDQPGAAMLLSGNHDAAASAVTVQATGASVQEAIAEALAAAADTVSAAVAFAVVRQESASAQDWQDAGGAQSASVQEIAAAIATSFSEIFDWRDLQKLSLSVLTEVATVFVSSGATEIYASVDGKTAVVYSSKDQQVVTPSKAGNIIVN